MWRGEQRTNPLIKETLLIPEALRQRAVRPCERPRLLIMDLISQQETMLAAPPPPRVIIIHSGRREGVGVSRDRVGALQMEDWHVSVMYFYLKLDNSSNLIKT